MDETAARWRAALLEVVRAWRNEPVLLSGGMDSVTLLRAAVELGGLPPCYTYRLDGEDGPDFEMAARVARDLGVPFREVVIPRTRRQLEADVREVIDLLRTARKTSVQCAQPIMHLARRVRADGFARAVVGTGAICLDDRTVMVVLGERGEGAAREYRRDKLEDRYRDCGTGRMHEMALLCGVRLEEPYSDEPLRSVGLELDVAELNRPRQKGIALRAFPDLEPYWRRNVSLQVAGGVRAWHEELLGPNRGRPGAGDVTVVYNRVLEEVTSGQQRLLA